MIEPLLEAELELSRQQSEARMEEIRQLKAQLAGKYSEDPDMAFDDELGWLHKSVLASVNEMRKALAEKEKAMGDAELLASYAACVRLDRKRVDDGQTFCLQTIEWCRGLVERIDAFETALSALRKEGEKG